MFLELFISGSVDQMAAVEVFRFVVQNPCGEFLPVGEHGENYVFCYPVHEQLAGSWILFAGTSAQGYAVQLFGVSGPCSGRTDQRTFAAADAAAGVFVNLAVFIQA